MKRYLLFGGEWYYPSGGWGDFVDSFDTKEQAFEVAKSSQFSYLEWCHIIDSQTGEYVGNKSDKKWSH